MNDQVKTSERGMIGRTGVTKAKNGLIQNAGLRNRREDR
jgi:hypothetical protein